MKQLPARPNLDHLKSQAKDLLDAFRAQDPEAIARFAALNLHEDPQLSHAQLCIAREYGFASWPQLKEQVELRLAALANRPANLRYWLRMVYGVDRTAPNAAIAHQLLTLTPDLLDNDPWLLCAIGDSSRITDPNLPGGPLAMPPLLALLLSSYFPTNSAQFVSAAEALLNSGADVNSSWPHPDFPSSGLTPLYAASGLHYHADLTRLLLARGANPNDGESLYHSVASPDKTCARLLLEAGARITGCNALYHQLDYHSPDGLALLLSHNADPNERSPHLGSPLMHAIRRRRSAEHFRLLINAGANPDEPGLYYHALQSGMPEAAALLKPHRPPTPKDEFLAACTAPDRAKAESLLAAHPGLFSELSPLELGLLPQMVAVHHLAAVETMVELGWPLTATGGDWGATALNLAVFQGLPDLTRYLLARGSSWEEKHGFGDNVMGTLSWASRNKPSPFGDWIGCAQALLEAGMPLPPPNYEFGPDLLSWFEAKTKGN